MSGNNCIQSWNIPTIIHIIRFANSGNNCIQSILDLISYLALLAILKVSNDNIKVQQTHNKKVSNNFRKKL